MTIFYFPNLFLVSFVCCHHIVALPRSLVAIKGTRLFSGTPLKSRISSTVAHQSRNSSGCRLPWNSGISVRIPVSHHLRSSSAPSLLRLRGTSISSLLLPSSKFFVKSLQFYGGGLFLFWLANRAVILSVICPTIRSNLSSIRWSSHCYSISRSYTSSKHCCLLRAIIFFNTTPKNELGLWYHLT